ncbi:cystathionine gamma-synthase [Pseudidiomarina aestuarii]|uniref:Cytochrome c-type biogenesis protein n=1 Tax=Pseudidiomarina aestuarii TaxID=624146 RepID=A0A7Z6ZUB1_9GAMM|nr:cytochrome c-type biogenesis protein [Pseudidiomarina aestuarii]RUO41549.1 cystathionine gamma-synthase [Pseudidiomarina aestuarii]
MTRVLRRCALISAVLLSFSIAAANLETYQFDDPAKEALFRELIDELRCPKCQNQSIADSDAPLAKDLRDRTYAMVQAGASKRDVIEYMVTRYGDFAYYQPPVQTSTLVLWVLPSAVVVIGALVIVVSVRRRQTQVDDEQLTAEEQARLDALRKQD